RSSRSPPSRSGVAPAATVPEIRSSAIDSTGAGGRPVPVEIEVELSIGRGVVARLRGLEARQVLEIGTDVKRQQRASRFRRTPRVPGVRQVRLQCLACRPAGLAVSAFPKPGGLRDRLVALEFADERPQREPLVEVDLLTRLMLFEPAQAVKPH